MSIVAAFIDGERTIIGSDTMAVSTGGRPAEIGGKWIEGKNDWWFGQIGDSRVADLIRNNIEFLTAAIESPDDFVEKLIQTFEEDGRMKPQYPSDTTVPVWCSGGLLVRPGHIWDLDSQLCLTPIAKGTLIARGCGAEAAMGAAWAVQGEEHSPGPNGLVALAIQCAAVHNVHVRGLWVRTVDSSVSVEA